MCIFCTCSFCFDQDESEKFLTVIIRKMQQQQRTYSRKQKFSDHSLITNTLYSNELSTIDKDETTAAATSIAINSTNDKGKRNLKSKKTKDIGVSSTSTGGNTNTDISVSLNTFVITGDKEDDEETSKQGLLNEMKNKENHHIPQWRNRYYQRRLNSLDDDELNDDNNDENDDLISNLAGLSIKDKQSKDNSKDNGVNNMKDIYINGYEDDRKLLSAAVTEKYKTFRAPGNWSLENQARVSAWCQQLGASYRLYGGYCEISLPRNMSETMRDWKEIKDDYENYRKNLPKDIGKDQYMFHNKSNDKQAVSSSASTAIVTDENLNGKFNRISITKSRISLAGNRIPLANNRISIVGNRLSIVGDRMSLLGNYLSFVQQKQLKESKKSMMPDIIEEGDEDNIDEDDGDGDLIADDENSEILVNIKEEFSPINDWKDLCCEFPLGSFLSQGSYKDVFKVFSASKNRVEAMSIMNIDEIQKLGNVAVVSQEISVSLVLSELVQKGDCPNFIEIFQIFEFDYPPPGVDIWNVPLSNKLEDVYIQKKNDDPEFDILVQVKKPKRGNYQYIRMEFCDLGDLEEYIKTQPDMLLPIDTVREVLFQMIYGLYVAREKVSLRHYDVKLLNYFVKSKYLDNSNLENTSATDAAASQNEKRKQTDVFSINGRRYKLSTDLSVKLGDYGTADIDPDTLGKPISVDHFTTLENSPMEFLLHPDAPQSYEVDTFALGLSALHLFTGKSPYEEIMADVKCPDALFHALNKAWRSTKTKKPFEALITVLDNDENDVLYHTLYRFVVLFGSGSGDDKVSKFGPTGPIWEVVQKVLGVGSFSQLKNKAHDEELTMEIKQARQQFRSDRTKYSLIDGTNEMISRARERLKQADGAWELVQSMLTFDPSNRPSMRDCLRSSFFDPLKV